MKRNAGARIPTFTSIESKQVKGSYDFIGIIHYTNVNVTDNSGALNIKLRDYTQDMAANIICKYTKIVLSMKEKIKNKIVLM